MAVYILGTILSPGCNKKPMKSHNLEKFGSQYRKKEAVPDMYTQCDDDGYDPRIF